MINAQGGWEFKVDNAAVQYLDAGEKITQVYTVSTADGNDTETITITINGAEDPSNILVDGSNGDSDAGAVTEDKAEDLNNSGQLVTGGTLTVTDADGDGAFSPTVTLSSVTDETGQTTNDGSQTGLGSLVINAQGGWEFKVDNAAVQYLDAGEKITQVYTVSTADGNDTETITITINGAEDPSSTNQSPDALDDPDQSTKTVRYGNSNGAAEDTELVSWQNTVLNADSGLENVDAGVVDENGNDVAEGTLKIGVHSPDAVWETDAGQKYQIEYRNGNTPDDISDDSYESLSIKLNGLANSAQVSVGSFLTHDGDDQPAPETLAWFALLNGQVVASGSATASDGSLISIATGDLLFDEIQLAPTEREDSNKADTNNSDFYVNWVEADQLDGGFLTIESQPLTITSDKLLINDSDPDDDPLTITGISNLPAFNTASLTWDAKNGVVFDPGSDFDYLAAGQTETITFDYTIEDGHGGEDTAQVTITVVGDSTTTVYESGLVEGTQPGAMDTSASGQLRFSEVDGKTLSVVCNDEVIGDLTGNGADEIGSLSGEYGLITFYGDGTWSYQLNSQADHIPGTTPYEQFDIKLNDGEQDSGAIVIKLGIEDDTVAITETSTAYLPNTSGHSFTGVLNTLGADIQYNADLSGNIDDWGTGDPAITHADTNMTSGGLPLYYYVDPADTSVLIAYTDSSGSNAFSDGATQTEVFRVTADPNNDRYVVETPGSGSGLIDVVETTTLDGVNGGNSFFQVLIEGESGYEVKTYSSEGDWLADNAIKAITVMAISAVEVTGPDQTENIKVNWSKQAIGSASGWINGATEVLTMKLVAGDVIGAQIGIDVQKGAYIWRAYDKDGKLLDESSSGGITSSTFEVKSVGVISYIEFSGADDGSSFRIKNSVETSFTHLSDGQGAEPIKLGVEVSDQDGDTALTSIPLNFTAYQKGEDNLDDPKDDLVGTAGSDYLAGGTGNDTLKGDPDGESSTDVFAFNISDLIDGQTVQTDTLLDFALGKPGPDAENGDILDISGLVDFGASEALIPEILGQKGITASYDEASQTATITFITSNDESSTDTLNIVFSNTTGWSDPGSDGIDSNDVLQQLINNGQLIV